MRLNNILLINGQAPGACCDLVSIECATLDQTPQELADPAVLPTMLHKQEDVGIQGLVQKAPLVHGLHPGPEPGSQHHQCDL